MLLHATPCLQTSTWGAHGRTLIDVSIPEIGVTLREGRELMARTPFPNKTALYACAKGRKAQYGILLDVGDVPGIFTLVTRWAVDAGTVLVHELEIELADRRHEVIAATAWDWGMFKAPGWHWDSVRLPWMTVNHLMGLDAWMQERSDMKRDVVRPCRDTVQNGLVVRRLEAMQVPTIELERYDCMLEWSLLSKSQPDMPKKAITLPRVIPTRIALR